MNITSIGNLSELNNLNLISKSKLSENRNASFESLFQSAMNMINETNQLTNAAEESEMAYSLGLLDNPHDLQIAQQKANLALQYTVAVRNQVLDAYKEIMTLQF